MLIRAGQSGATSVYPRSVVRKRFSTMFKFPRHQKIGLLLYSIAYALVWWKWPTVSIDQSEWKGYAIALSLIASVMAVLVVVSAVSLYALSGTPIVKFLREKGALKGLLFNLTTCAILLLIALGLGLGLLGSIPSQLQNNITLHIATVSAVAGFLYFGPIGYAFWLLLRHIGHKPSPAVVHDFDKPTDLN